MGVWGDGNTLPCLSYVHIGDQSAILREGYWASYNIPFYEDVFNISGYPKMVKELGPTMSHALAPRAKIFRRDQGKVVTTFIASRTLVVVSQLLCMAQSI